MAGADEGRRAAIAETILGLALALGILAAAPLAAQDSVGTLIVTRNVNLRRTPSTAIAEIRLLRPPDELVLVAAGDSNGYYHVRTEDDETGWVWRRNVRPAGADDEAPALAATVPPATSFDAHWIKPLLTSGTFTSAGRQCGPTGDGGDEETNRLKNRTDVPPGYHDVTFEALAGLPYPVDKPHRHDWTTAHLNDIARYEGTPVRVIGYIVALKPQTGGSGESTNCHWTGAAEVDWHIALVGEPGKGEEESVVVETTPRVRRNHPQWTAPRLRPWVDAAAPVRISGWLMLDPEHRNHLGRYRGTLWEVHPITQIEVWQDTAWVSLDSLP